MIAASRVYRMRPSPAPFTSDKIICAHSHGMRNQRAAAHLHSRYQHLTPSIPPASFAWRWPRPPTQICGTPSPGGAPPGRGEDPRHDLPRPRWAREADPPVACRRRATPDAVRRSVTMYHKRCARRSSVVPRASGEPPTCPVGRRRGGAHAQPRTPRPTPLRPRRCPAGSYYELLGLDLDASEEDIKAAFRRRAKELHPDVNKEVGTGWWGWERPQQLLLLRPRCRSRRAEAGTASPLPGLPARP
jgi:hypothetical protein